MLPRYNKRPDLKILSLVLFIFAVFLTSGQASAQSDDDDDRRAVNDALRILKNYDDEVNSTPEGRRKRQFLYPTPPSTYSEADIQAFLRSGRETFEGTDVRQDISKLNDRFPYFEGTLARVYNPFMGRYVVAYAKGVYAVPGEAAYVGNFTYLPKAQMGATSKGIKSFSNTGSYVITGKRIDWDGSSVTGLFIDEDVVPGHQLRLLRATPAYFEQFERRHAAAVKRHKQRFSGQRNQGGANFGALISLGLSAALIGGSDLSVNDKMGLAESFMTEAMGGGDGGAVLDTVLSQTGAGGNKSGPGLFSGNQVFDAPGLNQAMDLMLKSAAE